jgi:hypothetical protein
LSDILLVLFLNNLGTAAELLFLTTARGCRSCNMPQAKLTSFLSKQGVKSSKKAASHSSRPKQQQARLENLPGVLVLPKMSGHATEAELHRILSEMDAGRSDEAIIHALRQLACYEVTVDQVSSTGEWLVLQH